MKILLLADPASTHTIKWANSLSDKGNQVFIFGLSGYKKENYRPGIQISTLSSIGNIKLKPNGSVSKIYYLVGLKKLKAIINLYAPDIIHAHYASSYGLLGALSGFHPFILSVWGTDVLKFPEKSFIHKNIIKYNLIHADRILATSHFLAQSVLKYCNKHIDITPFGVDTCRFKPTDTKLDKKDGLVIGTVKTMEDAYGIGYLIHSFKLVKENNRDKQLKLLLVGGGSQIEKYKSLTAALDISKDVTFTGYIEHDKIPEYHNMMDIEVFLSEYESFGVSVLEASACGKPVVVSGVGGLVEVVDNNSTGLIVPPGNIEEAASAINKLIKDESFRYSMGQKGRQKVIKQFSWENSVECMLKIYNEVIS